jgi:glycosyltransferase involved in cell wall biosynthesis
MSQRGVAVELSIIIPSFRSGKNLATVLSALVARRAGRSWEILVVDSSGDSCATQAAQEFHEVRVIASAERLTAGAARNLGAASAAGPTLLFLDADCIPEPDWSEKLEAALRRDRPVQSGAIVNGTPESLAGTLQYWVEFADFSPRTSAGSRRFVSSFQLLIRRAEFMRANGFPAEFLRGQDLVFSHRLTQAGIPIHFDPALRVQHLNLVRFRLVFGHLFQLGQWSGRARRSCPSMRGARLGRFPFLLPGLVLYRWLKLLWQIFGDAELGPGRSLMMGLLSLPAFVGWGAGFAAGLWDRRWPPR